MADAKDADAAAESESTDMAKVLNEKETNMKNTKIVLVKVEKGEQGADCMKRLKFSWHQMIESTDPELNNCSNTTRKDSDLSLALLRPLPVRLVLISRIRIASVSQSSDY